jgi:transposase
MLSKEAFIVLHHYLDEGLTKTAIAKKLGVSRRTVQRYVGSDKREPSYSPRPRRPTLLDPFKRYLDGRLEAFPELSAVRLLAEIQGLGYGGCYMGVKDTCAAGGPNHR